MQQVHEQMAQAREELQQSRTTVSLLEQRLHALQKAKEERTQHVRRMENKLAALQDRIGDITTFHLPEPAPYPGTPDSLPHALHDLAAANGLREISVRLDNQQVPSDPDRIALTAFGSGHISGIRSFIINLLETPYVSGITRVECTACEKALCLEIQCLIRM